MAVIAVVLAVVAVALAVVAVLCARRAAEERRRADLVASAVPEGLLWVDPSGSVVRGNDAAERLLGWPVAELDAPGALAERVGLPEALDGPEERALRRRDGAEVLARAWRVSHNGGGLVVVADRREVAEAGQRVAGLEAAVEAARQDAQAARQEADGLRGERDAALARLERTTPVAVLWALELLRTEREWRRTGPPGAAAPPMVRQEAGAELAVALDLERQRLREEAGLPSEQRGEADGAVTPATALFALRVAQEVMASMAGQAEHLEIDLGGDGEDLSLTLSGGGWDGPEAADPTFEVLATTVAGLGGNLARRLDGDRLTVSLRLPAGL